MRVTPLSTSRNKGQSSMKTYEVEGRTFTTRPLSLAVEDAFRELAFDDSGEFNAENLNSLSKDGEKLHMLLHLLLKGDHEGLDWRLDVDSDVVGEVLEDFFTRYAAKMKLRGEKLLAQSEM